MPEVFNDGDNLSVLVPSGLLATIKKDAPLRLGDAATGFNVVLTSDPKPTSETPTDLVGPVFAGGNAPGYASATRKGAHRFTVAFAIAALYTPVYIVIATGALTDTANAGANPQFGWALSTKSAPSGPLVVLIK